MTARDASAPRNLATWSVRRPLPSIVLFLLLTLLGLASWRWLPIQDLPDIELPAVVVSAELPGATPSQMETEVVRYLEDAVAAVAGVRRLRSSATEGESVTTVEFEFGTDLAQAVSDVRDAIARIRAVLPADIDEPVVARVTASGEPIQVFAVASTRMDESELSWFVDNVVLRELRRVPGVGRAARVGGVDREIRVALDPVQLQGLDVGVLDVAQALRSAQRDVSGGSGEVGGARQPVRTLAGVDSVAALSAFEVPLDGGRHLPLGRVAEVQDTVADRGQLALLDGRTVVGVQVFRSRGASEVAVGEDVAAARQALQRRHSDLRVTRVADQVVQARQRYDGSMQVLIEGAVLAVLVVFVFLRDWRATWITALALPLSILPTLAVMAWLGYSLNAVTLLALTLVIGVLVDDAIVEIENIATHLRAGKSPRQAAMDAATEIGPAVVATTLALVVVFLPTAFMPGTTGLLFEQFGWTVAIAVLMSLLVARLLTPMLAAYGLDHRSVPAPPPDGAVMRRYVRGVRWTLVHPRTTLAAAAVLFALSVSLAAWLPTGFIPAADNGEVHVQVELPPDAALADTRRAVERVRALVADLPEVDHVFAAIGGSTEAGLGDDPVVGGVHRADITLRLVAADARDADQAAIETRLRTLLRGVPGARIGVGGEGPGEGVELTLVGDDPAALERVARQLVREMRGLPGLGNVGSTASVLHPQIAIAPDRARAAELGVSAEAIAETVRIATAGDYARHLPRLNLPERQLDVRVQLADAVRGDLATLGQLGVRGRDGMVPLAAVARVGIADGAATIERVDRERAVTVTAELEGDTEGEALDAIATLPALRQLPAGVRLSALGDDEQLDELFDGFAFAMATGVLCMYLLLVLLLGDFRTPLAVLLALPLSVGGAFAALLVTGQSLSMPSLIGLVMLMGIAAKNSILLVDYAVTAMRDGTPMDAALLDACRKRARPVVMTSVAMVAGMLPAALGLGANAGFQTPMAIAVIGGLASSTALSLVVVPAAFRLVGGARRTARTGGETDDASPFAAPATDAAR